MIAPWIERSVSNRETAGFRTLLPATGVKSGGSAVSALSFRQVDGGAAATVIAGAHCMTSS